MPCLKVRESPGGGVRREKNMPDEETFLNPDFWQAVGLTLRRRETRTCTTCDKGERKCPWHQFIDHLAEGKAPEAFFRRLSSTEKKQPLTKSART
jgi:hypothetical protein